MTKGIKLAIIIWLGVMAIVAGVIFTRPKPHNWKVKAETPIELDEWNDERTARMSPDLKTEYVTAFNLHLIRTPKARPRLPYDRNDALCSKLHNLTVRDVVILAYTNTGDDLNRRLNTANDALVQNITNQNNENLTSQEKARFERAIAFQRSEVNTYEKLLAENQKKLEDFKKRYP